MCHPGVILTGRLFHPECSGLMLQVGKIHSWVQSSCDLAAMRILTKNHVDRTWREMKWRQWFVVACCICFVLFCLGCPEQLIKLFANSAGQSRQNTGQEVFIYRQNINKLLVVLSTLYMSHLYCFWLDLNNGSLVIFLHQPVLALFFISNKHC